MKELSRYLFLAGALPFLLLGAAHAVHTPRQPYERKGLSPSDPSLAESMARSRVLVFFNLSHSLGIVLFGVLVVLVGRTSASFGYNAALFLPLAVVVSIAYLSLGVAYSFRTPIIGIGLSVFTVLSRVGALSCRSAVRGRS